MSTYCFVLGKGPELSMAELMSVFPIGDAKRVGDCAFSDGPDGIGQKEFNRLGGSIKMARLEDEVTRNELVLGLVKLLHRHYGGSKLNYGISVYGWDERNLRDVLLKLKKALKKEGISSRFINQGFKNVSSAQYKGIRNKGVELMVIKKGPTFVLAEVVAVQDIDSYSKRDFDKPFRDMKVGMLPPKLAQIMVNLTGSDGVIWDPFCGGGVLIMEGLLMGHMMIGSDINPKTLEGAKKNVEWIRKEFNVEEEATLFVHDATKPLKNTPFDAIAAEGYLGPPQNDLLNEGRLALLKDELIPLYVSFFESIKAFGFPGPIVFAFPFYRMKNGNAAHLDELIDTIKSLGFSEEVHVKYARPNQVVGRDIYRFRPSL